MRKILLLALSIFSFLAAFAQVDTEFWFAVPHICEHSRVTGGYHMVLFSYDKPAHIELSMPANSAFVTKTYDLNAYDYVDIEMAQDYDDAVANFEVPFDVVSQRGIHITSTSKIGGYYNHTGNNAEAYSLKNEALGTNFGVVSQTVFQIQSESETYEDAYSSAQIVATEDNTIVTITPVTGHPVSPNCNATPIVVHLNRGETYAVRSCSKDPLYGVNGMRISSNKPIAVCSTDDSTQAGTGAAGLDLTGEQLVSLDFAGKKYAAIGQQNSWNSCSITALENGTTVTLSTGQVLNMQKDETQNISMATVQALYIESNKDVLVYQITGEDDEAAGTMLPALDCTGSRYVAYKRMPDSYMTFLNIVTKSSNINSIYINNSKVASSQFHPVPGTGNAWFYASIQKSGADDFLTVECKSGFIQLGVLDMKGTSLTDLKSCTYGYFSDYGTAHEYDEYAYFDEGGIYTWPNHYRTDGITPQTFTDEGIYKDTLTDNNGCDSICVLHLSKIPYPDNIDDATGCMVPPSTNVWSIRQKAISEVGNIDDCGTTFCGDIDGDGQIEILAPIITDDVKFSKIGIFNSQAKAKRIIDVPTCSAFINIAIAKVKVSDSDYRTLIFFLAYDRYLYAYDPNGSQFWKSDQQFTSHSGEAVAIASLSLADFNHDGWTEIYIGPEVFDAATGKRLAKYNGNKGHSDRAWKASRQSYQSVVADVVGDDKLELILGNTACSVNINSRTDESQNSITAVNSVPAANMKMEDNSNIPSTDGHTLLADMDGDGKLDVVVMHIDKTNRVIYIYVWNPRTGSMICTKKITNAAEFGTPNVGDIDHDGNLELNFIIGTYSGETTDANDKIYSLKYNKSTHNLEVFWTLHHDDASGSTGLSLFDFNQDGTMEIVYRDCEHLRIINGSKIHHITGNPVAAPYDLANIPCTSGTGVEYPVIADVDADGEAEIVVVGNGSKLVIYESDLAPWAPARSVWNQFAYNITNVNEDLTIPTYLYNNAHIFTDVSSTTRQPFNNFLAQTTTINKQGVPFIAAADAAVSTCSHSVENDSIVITLKYCNNGDANLLAPYEITTYQNEYRGTVVQVDTIKEGLAINECKTITIKVPSLSVCKAALDTAFIIAINDDGHGIAQHGNQQAECDTTNNTYKILLPTDLRRDTAYLNVTISQGESYIFNGHTYATDTQDTATFVSASGCDSVCILDLKVIPYPDDVITPNCTTPLENNDWSIKTMWSSEDIISPLLIPLVGDVNNDGTPDILCFASNETYKTFGVDKIYVIDGISHNIIKQVNIGEKVSTETAGVYGIIKLNNAHTVVVVITTTQQLRAYDLSAANTPLLWETSVPYFNVNINFADFNNDGYPEIYIGSSIYDVETGTLLAYRGDINTGTSFTHGNKNSLGANRALSAPFAADIDKDGFVDLIVGNEIYKVTINNRNGLAGNSIDVYKVVTPPSGVPIDGHTQIADFNMDGYLDVLISVKASYIDDYVYYYVWDVHNNQISTSLNIYNEHGKVGGKNIPLITDIDNDGFLEIIIQSDAINNDGIDAYKYNYNSKTFVKMWNLPVDEDSYSNTMTMFDLDHNGIGELIITDQSSVRIVNGSGKSHKTGNDTIPVYEMSSFAFGECTIMQYPVIADVNNDGSAEIVAIGLQGSGHTHKGSLNIFTSAGKPWAPARSVWNQYMYNVFNVNSDLTIPTIHYDNAMTFADPDNPSIIRRPYNNFFQQSTTIDQYGRYVNKAADVDVSTTTTTTYENDSIKIDISFCNQGDLQVNAPYCITAYKNAYRGSVLFVDTIKAILPIGDCLLHQVGFPISNVCSDKDINSIVIAVNDDGHGIAQHGNQQAECDTTNNSTSVSLPTDFRSDTTKYTPVICATELPYTFTPTGTIFPVGTTSGRTIIPETNKYGCDSIITIDLTVNPILYGDTFAVVYHANTYEWYGETFTTEGNYPHTLSSKVTGCDSIVTLHLTFVPYPDNVADVECVVPPIPSSFEIKEIYKVDGVHSMATPLVADLDGDGKTEIICSKWPDGKLIYGSDGFLIIDGITGQVKDTLHTCRYPICGQPISIADVDGDGKCEIFLSDLDNYAYCYSHTGTLKWKSSFALDGTYIPLLGHLTDDEIPELFFGKYIFNPVTGTLIHEIAFTPNGTGWGAPHGVGDVSSNINARGYHLGALADVDKDGKIEYCAGNTIYKLNISNPNGQSGNSSSVFKQVESIAAIHNYDGQTLIVDFDNDGNQDICVLGLPKDLALTSPQPEYNIYVWNSSTGAILAHEEIVGVGQEPKDHTWVGLSIPYCGDLNGDGFVDLTFSAKGLAMYTYTYDATSPNHMRQVHNYAPFNETCGYTVFDFNMDGNAEIVYRGTHTLNIVDGSTLTPLSTPTEAFSGTVTEYPVVADVNGDGQADIIIHRGNYEWPDRTKIREDIKGWVSVYSAATSGAWSSARSVWNQWAYNSININDDMSVPQYMYDVSAVYPNGTKPFNSFLAQNPIIDQQGDIFVPAADAAVTSCNNSIQNDSIEITVNFCNNGDANLVAPFEVTTYKNAYRGEVIKTDTIYQTLTIGNCTSLTTKIPVDILCSNKEIQQLLIAINDDGHGIAQHGNQQAECDTTNNRTSVSLPTDFRCDTTKYTPVICATELPYTFTPTGTIFPVGTTSGRTIIPETNKYGCDSIITIDLTVNPTLTGDTTATFCNGTPFIWHGTSYPTGGDYPYTYTSKVTGCDSIVTLHLTQLEPTDSIENVTLCAGGTHTWHGQTFTSSTTITETIPNAAGCDSVCTLNLTILPALTGDTSATFCNGKSFTWHGTQYSIAGHYPYTYTSKVAPYCDSIVTLHLTQLEPTDSIEKVTLCYGESHVWHGQTFTTSTTITETIPNAAGCDSVCTLNLTILPALTGDTSATFCNGTPFIWHDTPYATGGDYQYTYTSKVAPYCDSIVTLHLTQLEPTDSIEVVTICYGGSHTWHGHTYTATTTTTETIDNAVGCDSVCTLKLTVLPAITGDTNMTVCDTLLPVTWRGQSITGAGEYYHTATASSGCDSTITLHVTVETCLTPALTCDTLEATFIVPDICADDDSMYIDITYTKGLPVSYNVTFGADAVAQGFQSSYTGNVRITSSTTASISIPIPNDPTNRQVYPKPNVYSIDISILDTCDAYTTWRSQNFLIHYPSWLTLQRWNDVISLYNERYNGGYVFSQIRWFHEGTLLESRGDHDGYIYQRPTLVYGDAYWAELTRADDGVTITTCPIYPVPMTDSTKMDDVTDPYIIVTPTVVTPSNPTVTVKTNICGEYYVYYVDGHLLDKQNFCPKDNHTFTIDIDPCYVRTGLYILVFYGEEGTIKAVKLLVEP